LRNANTVLKRAKSPAAKKAKKGEVSMNGHSLSSDDYDANSSTSSPPTIHKGSFKFNKNKKKVKSDEHVRAKMRTSSTFPFDVIQ